MSVFERCGSGPSRGWVYSLFATVVLITGIAVSLLVLASAMADVAWLRGLLVAGLLLAFVTLWSGSDQML